MPPPREFLVPWSFTACRNFSDNNGESGSYGKNVRNLECRAMGQHHRALDEVQENRLRCLGSEFLFEVGIHLVRQAYTACFRGVYDIDALRRPASARLAKRMNVLLVQPDLIGGRKS